jgi:hypothetical protein
LCRLVLQNVLGFLYAGHLPDLVGPGEDTVANHITTTHPRQLLSRILEEPSLARSIQGLAPHTLGRLIQHVGLEDAGELLPFATTEQLLHLFDGDLWTSATPGKDETFDAERFVTWLEVMLEAGEDVVARRLAELPEELVLLAFSSHILVLDMDALAEQWSAQDEDDANLAEKALESTLYQEIDEHRVISKRPHGWDAIITSLVALEKEHHSLLTFILDRCCAISSDYIEENGGLYEVLTSGETLEADVSGQREERRARQGFIAPSAAASFLSFARQDTSERGIDFITASYFKALDRGSLPMLTEQPSETSNPQKTLESLLQEAEIIEQTPAPRQLEASSNPDEELFTRALSVLSQGAPELASQRSEELAYLVNVLLSGCSKMGRSLLPKEALEIAVATCNLALDHLGGDAALLTRESVVRLFRIGWRILYQEVILVAARVLEQALEKSKNAKSASLKKALKILREARDKPWTAKSKMIVTYEGPTWLALTSLLDECPSLAGALGTDQSPQLIATMKQLQQAKVFLSGLRG